MTAEMSIKLLELLGELRTRLVPDIEETRSTVEYYREKGLERDAEEYEGVLTALRIQLTDLDTLVSCMRIQTEGGTLSWENVRRAIRISGMSSSDFAHAAGVPPMSIGLLRNGKSISIASRRNLSAAVRYWGCM